MQTVSTYAAAATSYVVALFGIFYASVLENYSGIAALLGLVLLLARLVQEVPKAWRILFGKRKSYDDVT